MDFDDLKKTLTLKGSSKLLARFTEVLNESLADDTSLFDSGSLIDDIGQFDALVSHAQQLWQDSCLLLNAKSYATSVVLSIATMEELGKIAVARFLLPVNEQRRTSGVSTQKPTRRNPLYSHRQKHQLAAFGGFVVNNRADRILGIDNIVELFNLTENGMLETIRQSSLYSEPCNGRIQVPLSVRSRDESVFFCSAAGELLAELGGFEPDEFERLIAVVDELEAIHPISYGYRLQISSAKK